MEKLRHARLQLADHMKSDIVDSRIKEMNMRFNNLANDISHRCNFADIHCYSKHSPTDLLQQVKRAIPCYARRYTHIYTWLIDEIRHCFSLAIEQLHDMAQNERSEIIRSVQRSFEFLPDELKLEYRSQVDTLIQANVDPDKKSKAGVSESLKINDADNQTISKFRLLVRQVTSERKNERFNVSHDEIVKKLRTYQADVERYLQGKDFRSAIDTARKVFDSRETVGLHINGVEEIYAQVRDLIVQTFEASVSALANICNIEDTTLIEKYFLEALTCTELSKIFTETDEGLLANTILQLGERNLTKMYEYLSDHSRNFQVALHAKDFLKLRLIVSESRRWERLIQLIKEHRMKNHLIQSCFQDMTQIVLYTDMISILQSYVNSLISQSSFQALYHRKTTHDDEWDAFFATLMTSIDELRGIGTIFNNILPTISNIDKLVDELKNDIQALGSRLCLTAKRVDLTEKDCKEYCSNYKCIMSFSTFIRLPSFDVQPLLIESEEYILDKIFFLRRIITGSGSELTKVGEALIKMKFLAENVSVMGCKISNEIDDALRACRLQYDKTAVSRLMSILEETELGNRLVCQHILWSIGEDRRTIREKMQKRDDLKYVLDELRGDDVVKDVLESRYGIFRQMYDALVANSLTAFNQKTETEPNCDPLISQTKSLIGKIVQSPTSVNWDQSLRDQIPELLAHIFAVWTLKNTQHYNASRGIDAAKAYLLMPHVAQVIAIFRILGIGHKKNVKVAGFSLPGIKRLSNGLVNNLVQVGTGEGKSVIMAVTACVFCTYRNRCQLLMLQRIFEYTRQKRFHLCISSTWNR